jgi:hypothetical protein
MNLEELKKEAYKDLPITDQEHLDQESFRNQEIKSRWLDYKSRFELLLIKNQGDYQRLYRAKWEYYGGKSDAKIYASKPFDIKVLKTDLTMYITSDNEVVELGAKIEYLKVVIKYTEGVIKSIDNRGWDVSHAIAWKKFEAGLM